MLISSKFICCVNYVDLPATIVIVIVFKPCEAPVLLKKNFGINKP